MEDKNSGLVYKAIQDLAAAQGVELVDYKIYNSQGACMVRCFVDYPSGGISVGECAALNSALSTYLEESKILGENFIVEVNSPGLDRRLETAKDFSRVKNKEISLWFIEPYQGMQSLDGRLLEVSENALIVQAKDKSYSIEISKIKVGKLRLVADIKK